MEIQTAPPSRAEVLTSSHSCYGMGLGEPGCPLPGHWNSPESTSFTLCVGEGGGNIARKGQVEEASSQARHAIFPEPIHPQPLVCPVPRSSELE